MTDLYVSEHVVERYRERIGTALAAADLRETIANLLRPAAALGAKRYTIGGVTFYLTHGSDGCTVTTVVPGALPHPSHRKVPRSDVSRKESKRQQRQRNTRMNR